MDKLVFAKIGKGNNSINTGYSVKVLALCTSSYYRLSVYQVSFLYLQYFLEICSRQTYYCKKLLRQITVITCNGVMILALCTSSDGIPSMYQVLFNSLLYFQRHVPDKLNTAKIRKGSGSVNTGDRVMVLAFGDFPYGSLSVYEVSFNSLVYFQRYLPDKLFIAKIKKGSNSVNTVDRVIILAFCTSSDQCIKGHIFPLYTFKSEICSGQVFYCKN